MIRKIGILLILLLLSITGTQAQIMDGAYNPLILEHDGLERMAHIYEPDGDINAVMIALHGFYSSGRAMETLSGLNNVADERGWVIVYPEASDAYWDDGRVEAGLPPVDNTVDDVGYLASLSDSLRANYEVDTVYLTGLALGGSMAMRAACETPEKYNAVAIISALMWSYQVQYCENAENHATTNMIFIHGEQDHIYWKEGRPIVSFNLDIMSAEATVNFWATHNGCESVSNENNESTGLLVEQNCDENATLAYLSIVGGGNNWTSMADNSLNRTGIDTAQLIAGFFSEDADWETLAIEDMTNTEIPRSYTLYVPTSYDPTTETPVVLSLHGLGANTFSQASSSGFNQLAEQYGFIAIYPQAYDINYDDPRSRASWNYNFGTSMGSPHTLNDDVFLDNIVDDLAHVLNVDMNRLYVNGLSNGGYMVNHLACTRGNRYAAFASVAASAHYGIQESCANQADEHAPIMFYHGTADYISPWNGSLMTGRDIYLLAPISGTLSFWLNQNDCGLSYRQRTLESSDPESTVMYIQYTDCPSDSAMELYAVIGGGHVWHGVEDFENDFVGENNMDINVSEAIWDFYSRYALNGQDTSNSTDFSIGDTPETIGSGLPEIPMTLAELLGGDDVTPELELITAFQRGGFKLYFTLDMSEPFDCEANSFDEEILATFEETASAFPRMNIKVDTVIALDDCRAIAVAEYFTDEPASIAIMNDDMLLNTLNRRPAAGKIIIVIGDETQLEEILDANIEENHSVAIFSDGNTINPLASFPPETWSPMADYYENLGRD